MDGDVVRATRTEVERLAGRPLDWVTLATQLDQVLRRALGCSGCWLAEHEYVVDERPSRRGDKPCHAR